MKNVFVVIPNWNGKDFIGKSLDSLRGQLDEKNIIVVDNGSVDGSVEFLEKFYSKIRLIKNSHNLGFAGGVNVGIRDAFNKGAEYVALLNNDAIANKEWLESLYSTIAINKDVGIVTSKILGIEKNVFDSTGDFYTNWFLPFSRGRDVEDSGQYEKLERVTSASGGASIYRVEMLKIIGLFDEDFFAYYEDFDISLRAHHYGWKVLYQPKAIVRHKIGATSKNIKGFTTYQTIKNLPLLIIKNVPIKIIFNQLWKFNIAYTTFIIKSILKGQSIYAFRGLLRAIYLTPKKITQRKEVISKSRMSAIEFNELLIKDLPPKANGLRKLRSVFTFGLK